MGYRREWGRKYTHWDRVLHLLVLTAAWGIFIWAIHARNEKIRKIVTGESEEVQDVSK